MNQKGIMKLNYLDKSRNLNYCKKDDYLVSITSGKSNKVAYMKDHDEVELQFGNEFVKATPEIITDPQEIKSLFDYMTSEDNNHFVKFLDIFVALKFRIKA